MKKYILFTAKLGIVGVLASSCQFDNKIVESSYSNQYYVIDKAADIPFTITMAKNFDPLLELDDVEKFYHQTGYRDYEKQSKDWRILNPKYRELTQTFRNHKYINCLRQVLAQDILINKALINQEGTDGIEAIGYYTNELKESGSANTVLLYNCALRLKDNWKKSKIENLAKNTLNNYEELIKRNRVSRKSYDEEIAKERDQDPGSLRVKLYDKLRSKFEDIEKKQEDYALLLRKLN